MFYRKMCRVMLILLLCGRVVGAHAQGTTSIDRTAWLEKLKDARNNNKANAEFIAANPDVSYALVHDNWKSIDNAESRAALLTMFEAASNPHIVELLDLATTDNNGWVLDHAYDLIRGYAFRFFRWDEKAYRMWYEQNKGKPTDEVIRANGHGILESLPKVAP